MALVGLKQIDPTGASDGDVVTYDAGSGLWVPATPAGGGGASASLCFGGDFNNFDFADHALVNGDSRGNTILALNDRTQAASPVAGTSLSFGWSTETGGITTVIKIVKNGLVVDTITLTGLSGAVTGRPVSTLVGDLYAIEVDSGAAPNGSNFVLVVVP